MADCLPRRFSRPHITRNINGFVDKDPEVKDIYLMNRMPMANEVSNILIFPTKHYGILVILTSSVNIFENN